MGIQLWITGSEYYNLFMLTCIVELIKLFSNPQSSDGEELVRLVQLDNQFVCPRPTSITTDSTATNSTITERFNNVEELHDRLPSYYTALAPSRSAPWISPASHQVFNKLPAYITDIAPLDSANVTTCGSLIFSSYIYLMHYLIHRWVCRSTR